MAIILPNFLIVNSVISKGEGREPTVLCSLFVFVIYFPQLCEVLFFLCLTDEKLKQRLSNLAKVIQFVKQESLYSDLA